MKRSILIFFIVITLIINISTTIYAKNQQINSKYPAFVIRIIDGDTLKIIINGRKERIRLIGIDAPESRKNKKAYRDAARTHKDLNTIIEMGKKSTAFLKRLIKPGDKIFIEFDIQLRDKYGRLLGYVYLDNGQMLNEEILKAGYATLMTIPPNIKYVSKFYKAYLEARRNKRGLWAYQN